jgi:hypothetical protein
MHDFDDFGVSSIFSALWPMTLTNIDSRHVLLKSGSSRSACPVDQSQTAGLIVDYP